MHPFPQIVPPAVSLISIPSARNIFKLRLSARTSVLAGVNGASPALRLSLTCSAMALGARRSYASVSAADQASSAKPSSRSAGAAMAISPATAPCSSARRSSERMRTAW